MTPAQIRAEVETRLAPYGANMTARELAEALGVQQDQVYRALRPLVYKGRLKVQPWVTVVTDNLGIKREIAVNHYYRDAAVLRG